MAIDTPQLQIPRMYVLSAYLFAVVVLALASLFAYRALPHTQVELLTFDWVEWEYVVALPIWRLVLLLAALGSCGAILASLLDHKNQTLKPNATKNADRATLCYLLIRFPSALAFGVVAAYFSNKTELNIFSDKEAAMPAVAFMAAYLSNVSQLLKR